MSQNRLGSGDLLGSGLVSLQNVARRTSTWLLAGLDGMKADPLGLSVTKATLFIVGEMAGVAALILPSAVVDIGFSIATLVLITNIAVFSGRCLTVSLSEMLDVTA